jgi:hypothetical protein
MLFGAVIVVGWIFNQPLMLDPLGRNAPASFMGGLVLILASAMLCAGATQRRGQEALYGWLLLAVAAGTLYAHIFHVNFFLGIVADTRLEWDGTRGPATLSGDAAVAFLLLGIGHIQRESKARVWNGIGIAAAISVAILSGTVLIGYLASAEKLGLWLESPVRMAFMTAAGIFLLACGLVATLMSKRRNNGL